MIVVFLVIREIQIIASLKIALHLTELYIKKTSDNKFGKGEKWQRL